jgi:prepilin-type N-terminal cleavage/methylation domain-containing protein
MFLVFILLMPEGGVLMTKSKRLGFKLVELLVVIAIVAIAAMLFLSAIRGPHHPISERMLTMNYLRQCAVSLHNYHGTFKRFPDAAGTGGAYPKDPRTMWFHLLPYIEQDILYRDNIHNAVVPTYLSPLDHFITTPEGKLNFAANIRLFGYATLGKETADNAVDAAGAPTGATLSRRLEATMSGLKLSEITDGTSNVIMLTTRYAECGSPVASTYYSASPTGSILAAGVVPGNGGPANVGAPVGIARGGYFGAGAHDRPADRTTPSAIFQIAPTVSQCRSDDSVFGHAFGEGGLAVALADASVKSIDPNMSPTTFCRALCPSDGHALGDDWNDDN